MFRKNTVVLYHSFARIGRRNSGRSRFALPDCKGKWGDARTYDLTINSSRLGLDGTADALEAYIRARIVSEEKKEDVLQNAVRPLNFMIQKYFK